MTIDGAWVCSECTRKARCRELAFPSADGPTPLEALAAQVEHFFSFKGIGEAIKAESDPWRILDILYDRLVEKENTLDRVRDCNQHFRELWIQKLS